MPFYPGEFRNSFNSELARPSRFEVFFTIPQFLVNNDLATSFATSNGSKNSIKTTGVRTNDLALRCESAQLPSRTLMTLDSKIYGITEKYPYENSYNDAEFTFLVSGDMREKKFFDRWINGVSPKDNYHMNYKEYYESSVLVRQYDMTDKEQYAVELRHAFPISVNQLDLDWSSDGVHKLTVVFAFSDWISGKSA